MIQNIAVGAFCTIICSVFSLGLVGGFNTVVLSSVYTYLKQNDPYSTSVSYKSTVYTRSSGTGYISSSVGSIYKYDFIFYNGKNYVDKACTKIAYRHILPY